MKKTTILILFMVVIILLTSCWDRRLLKEHSLILSIGYDLNEDETISKTVSFPRETPVNVSEEGGSPSDSEFMTTKGNTVGEADIELERHLAQRFDRSKAQVLLIGEGLAKYGMFPTLDSMYRDPLGPLNAVVAIVSGRAEDGLDIEETQSFLISEFYNDLLKTAEESGIVKSENVQSICPVLLSGRKDIMIPLLKLQDGKQAFIQGHALFSKDKMTGELDEEQSIMSLILTDNMAKNLKMNLKISDHEKKRENNYVTFVVRKEKRTFDVYQESEDIKAAIHITLRIEIQEFAQNHLYQKSVIKKLEKQITNQLTDLANETIVEIKRANSDILGIGEQVKAHYFSTWKQVEWKEVYPEVPIEVKFDVEITRHGVTT